MVEGNVTSPFTGAESCAQLTTGGGDGRGGGVGRGGEGGTGREGGRERSVEFIHLLCSLALQVTIHTYVHGYPELKSV